MNIKWYWYSRQRWAFSKKLNQSPYYQYQTEFMFEITLLIESISWNYAHMVLNIRHEIPNTFKKYSHIFFPSHFVTQQQWYLYLVLLAHMMNLRSSSDFYTHTFHSFLFKKWSQCNMRRLLFIEKRSTKPEWLTIEDRNLLQYPLHKMSEDLLISFPSFQQS
jgi:hypothetical protein